MKTKLEKKLLRYNFFSIFGIVILLSFIYASLTYYFFKKNLEKDLEFIKSNYIENQKEIMKNQINNFIKYIEVTKKEILEDKKKEINKLIKIVSENIKIFLKKNGDIPIQNIKHIFKIFPYLHIKIYKNDKLILGKNIKLDFYKSSIIDNYKIEIGFKNKEIDNIIKQMAIKYLYSIRFGAKNNGYISIAEILNYKGGKKFARVVALPVNPKMVGKYLDSNKKDITGKPYRKEYLKIANTTGEGFVKYTFYKYSTKVQRPKLAYVKLYKPYNWLIFTSIFLDDMDSVIKQRREIILEEIKKEFIIYFSIYIVALIIIFFIAKKENEIFEKLIKKYKKEIEEKSRKLEYLNKHLEKEVQIKTKQLIDSFLIDPKTSLPNREKFLNNSQGKIVAIFNISDFKNINDFYGIEMGDKILKKVADEMNKIYPTYKLSGDEFGIIASSKKEAKKIADKIIEHFKQHPILGINIYFNVGIGKNMEEADIALKYAKTVSKPIIIYNKNLPIIQKMQERAKWREIIQKAIKEDNIIPFVQPIIDNNTLKTIKYECLMRLKHEEKYYPPIFLEYAKQTYQYETIQRIMITKCFKVFSKIKKHFSINLDIDDLSNEEFKKWLINGIKKHNISSLLTIEILETQSLNEKTINYLQELKNLGISIAIDDFGSGYSNFIYMVKKIPADTLKIDGSIIKESINNNQTKKLLQKIIEISKEFNFFTIAEFVENEEIFNLVKNLKIDASQGYYFSTPFEIEKLISSENEQSQRQ